MRSPSKHSLIGEIFSDRCRKFKHEEGPRLDRQQAPPPENCCILSGKQDRSLRTWSDVFCHATLNQN